jgi:hypothetical protein
MRLLVLLAMAWLVAAALPVAAQKTANTTHLAKKPSSTRPTVLSFAPGYRHVVNSPDGSLEITVTGPAKSLMAWVTVVQKGFLPPGFPFPVWPIEGSVDVLWRPDSQAFALTDYRYANRSYVLVFGARFHLGESSSKLGASAADLTPIVRKAFEKRPKEYYGISSFDAPNFYTRVLRWVGNNQLLVEVSAETTGPATFPNRGVKEWDLAYLVDVQHKVVARELSESQLLSQYGIKVAK